MELVLDGPVSLDPGGQGRGRGIVAGGGGDQVHDLDGLLPGLGDGPAQLGDVAGAGELRPAGQVGNSDDLDGAGGAPAVAVLGRG